MSKFIVLRILSITTLLLLVLHSNGQKINGHIKDESGAPLAGVNLIITPEGKGTTSDENGYYSLEISSLSADSKLVVRYVGFRSQSLKLSDNEAHLDIVLVEDRLGLEEVVVSGNRRAISRYNSPVIVETLKPELFDQVAALSLAEGLSFSPGLRVENNCQNCGFTQLRINGLGGAYSQILMNSRPIFSSLMAVYGLEMIPAPMVERVEVVRGGGSALYGGNAIGGTVNIITAEPHENRFYAGSQLQSIAGEAWENSQSFGASIGDATMQSGMNLFGFRRSRQAWDANQDGFTEITQLQNQTLGLNAYWKPRTRSKFSLDLFIIDEFRRGGSELERPPHQSRIAEQLEHAIIGGGLAYESLSDDGKTQYSVYTSGQNTIRDSYYGAGGRILNPGDSLSESDIIALNAYGKAIDYSFVAGGQISKSLNDAFLLSLGSEYQFNQVDEEIPGYNRQIIQSVNNWGSYVQASWKASNSFKLDIGSRFDINHIDGLYRLNDSEFIQDENFYNVSPRLNLQYTASDQWQIRASYARGFRVPQAFNEDLHIETVGGAALLVQIDEELLPESSNSFNLSSEHLITNSFSEHKLVLSGFYTLLRNPFVHIERASQINGTAVQLKSNGDEGLVRGLNLEYQGAWRNGLESQVSFTAQQAFFNSPQLLWEDEANDGLRSLSSDRFLRTPNLYGYFRLQYPLKELFTLNAALNYTGSMDIARLVDADTEELELLETPAFFDFQTSLERVMIESDLWSLRLKLGVKNIFNAFQEDLPTGADRDASYIYGPMLPRTYFLSINLDFQPARGS